MGSICRNTRGVPAARGQHQTRNSPPFHRDEPQPGADSPCAGRCLALKPQRSRTYLDYIRTLPCLICGAYGSESAHTGPHGLSQKACDFLAIPLCAGCHRTNPDSNHALGRRWATHHALDLPGTIGALNLAYSRLGERRSAAR